MIKFYKSGKQWILSYEPQGNDYKWVDKTLLEDGQFVVSKTFTFSKDDRYVKTAEVEENNISFASFDPEPIKFVFATLKEEYYHVRKGILAHNCAVYFHQDIRVQLKYFIAQRSVAIFRKLSKIITGDIYVGGGHETAIPSIVFKRLIASFPNATELNKYMHARMAIVLKEYVDGIEVFEANYNHYMNDKISFSGNNLQKVFKEYELQKYKTILEKLELMLEHEKDYSEHDWQKEILQIMLLLNPRYIKVLNNVRIKSLYDKDRFLDYLLVDANGFTDIVEIKKPFEHSIVREARHRDNFIPTKELSGTIMQLEKYIFLLSRWGAEGEQKLTENYSAEFPVDFTLKITSPGGIIIMGREHNLTMEQRADFEIIKRKYKNVVDIITYDNLLFRLKCTIEQIKKI